MNDSINWISQGWQCPQCKRIYSPSTFMCYWCGNTTSNTSDTTSGSQPIRDMMVNGVPYSDLVKSSVSAPEPRVLALEEVDALGDDAIVWLETVDSKDTVTLKPAIYQPDNSSQEEDGYYCVVSSWGQSGFYHKDDYMYGWRCWSSKPTDAQRKEAEWHEL